MWRQTAVTFRNCKFKGNQDTIYAAGAGSRQYFIDCYIDGTTDFIFRRSHSHLSELRDQK